MVKRCQIVVIVTGTFGAIKPDTPELIRKKISV
jgi:hypothetical protein